jgi:iron complex outermembrane receptor protein
VYKRQVGEGKMAFNLAGNFMLTNEIGGTPNDPAAVKSANASILNAQIKSLLTESRPKYKAILGIDYNIGKFALNLNNTLFGPTAFRDLDNGGSAMNHIKAVFKPAVITDLGVSYLFNDKISWTIAINNLFNILPKWDLEVNSIETDPVKKAAGEAAATQLLNNPNDKALLRGFLGFSGRYDILVQRVQLGRRKLGV